MSKLHSSVIAQIKAAGLTLEEYRAHCGYKPGEPWGGDVCGCTDDRCTGGYHHGETDECGCFAVLLEELQEEQLNRSEFKAFLSLLGSQELDWLEQELIRVLAVLKGEGKNE